MLKVCSGVYTINWTKTFCSCPAFTTYKPYPCKHIFLLTMVVPTLSWENLPSDYTGQSIFTADTTNELFENIKLINPISTQQKLTNHKDKEETENDNNEYDNTFIEDDKKKPDIKEILVPKKIAIKPLQRLVSHELETMRSRIYICKKKDALSQVLQNLKEMNEILIKNIITEEDLPLNSQDDTTNKRKHQDDDNEDNVQDTKRLKCKKRKVHQKPTGTIEIVLGKGKYLQKTIQSLCSSEWAITISKQK